MKLKKVLTVLTVLLLAFSLVACSNTSNNNDSQNTNENDENVAVESSGTTYPLTITDDAGNEITFEEAPERILSIAPSNTEILFALGLGDKVIGRTEFCTYPEEAQEVEVIGDYSGPNTERIIDLEPDVIFASFVSIPEEARQIFEASGIKIVIYEPKNIDDVLSSIKQIGQITNVQEEAEKLVSEMSSKREEIINKVKDADPKRVFIDIGDYYTVSPVSFIGSMLEEINAINIVEDTTAEYLELSLEKIIDENPEVYITTITPAEDIKKVPGIETIEAYKNDRIVEFPYGTLEHDMIQRPGPRVVDGLEIYAKAIHPEVFE